MPKCKNCKQQMKPVKGDKHPVCAKCRRKTRKFLKLLDIFCQAGTLAVVLHESGGRLPYRLEVVPYLSGLKPKVGHKRTIRRTRVKKEV
jgi:hypothetical protein